MRWSEVRGEVRGECVEVKQGKVVPPLQQVAVPLLCAGGCLAWKGTQHGAETKLCVRRAVSSELCARSRPGAWCVANASSLALGLPPLGTALNHMAAAPCSD